MTTDVRTLLHDSADVPSREPDLSAARERARTRRRRQRGFTGIAVFLVLALVTGAVALGNEGGDDAQVAIPRQSGAEVPEGWKEIQADPGITIAIPPTWSVGGPTLTPIGTPLVNASDLTPDADNVLGACTMHRSPTQAPTVAGSALTLWEFPPDSTTVPDVANSTLPVVDRPSTFAEALVAGPNQCDGARYDQLAFRESGRVFLVRVVSVFPSAADEQPRLRLAAQVLDTLRVEPLVGETTTSVPEATTIPPNVRPTPPTVVSPPTTPFVPSTTDEQEINDLYVAWLRDHPDDETRNIVEDADALLPFIHEGLAQHSAADLALYSGAVSAIRMLDADHAEVQYTLLHGGQPQFGLRTGVAVRIDGRWMVSRATECALLSLGGITCPPA